MSIRQNSNEKTHLLKLLCDQCKGFVDSTSGTGHRDDPLRTGSVWYVDFRAGLKKEKRERGNSLNLGGKHVRKQSSSRQGGKWNKFSTALGKAMFEICWVFNSNEKRDENLQHKIKTNDSKRNQIRQNWLELIRYKRYKFKNIRIPRVKPWSVFPHSRNVSSLFIFSSLSTNKSGQTYRKVKRESLV